MKGKKHVTIATVCAALLCSATFALSGCGGNNEDLLDRATQLPYSTGINEAGFYDDSMFYRNDLDLTEGEFADPSSFYCEEDGYYYFYATHMTCLRTTDFAHFENMGKVFTADSEAWSDSSAYWAPEVIYDKATQKYYLYYSARAKSVTNTNEDGRFRIGIAVSDKPYGPFHEWEGTRFIPKRDAEGKRVQENGEDVFENETLTKADYPIDFMHSPLIHEMGLENFAMIDAHPFFDGDDFYLYFVRHTDNWNGMNAIWGVKMFDMVTPDYDTLTWLTEPGRKTVGGEPNYEVGNGTNEGPFMMAHVTQKPNGETVKKYYLAFSFHGYTNPLYSVVCAVSDSPLGEFVKLDSEHGMPIIGIDPEFDHMAGTGHHSFLKCGDEYFVVYHAFTNHRNIKDERTLAFDRLMFHYNEELGYDLMYGNGPTYSLQPLPYVVTGYCNLAQNATVTASSVAANSSVSYLNDGRIAINSTNEFDFVSASDTVTVTVDFGKEVNVKAIMIYNGRNIYQAFSAVDAIRFESADGDYYIKDLQFPKEYISSSDMRPGGAAVAEFNEIKANKIIIKISKKIAAEMFPDRPNTAGISISDIVVIGNPVSA